MAFCPLFTDEVHYGRFWWHFPPCSLIKPIVAYFDGILPPFHSWGPLVQIFMAFSHLSTYEAHFDMLWWHFVPFWLKGPIKADFDGILTPFHCWGPLRQILIAFPPFRPIRPIREKAKCHQNLPIWASISQKPGKMPSKSAWMGPIIQKEAKCHQNLPIWAQ